jgi:putative peptidoglycan lipid II flippase
VTLGAGAPKEERRERADRARQATVPAPSGVDVAARHRGLLDRTALISFLTLLSRIAGFVREMKTAALFGHASAVSDAFVTAWRLPNMFRGLMIEGAIVTAVQTELTRADHRRGLDAGRAFFRTMLGLVARALVALCLAAMAVAWLLPDRMPLTGWAWLGQEPAAVRELALRMLPFVVLVCLSAVVGGALNVRGRFFAPSLAPVVMNLGWIAALFLIGSLHATALAGASGAERSAVELDMARGLATYVLLSGALLLVVQLPALRGAGLAGAAPADEQALARAAAWRALKASLPLAFGAAAYQVNVLVGGALALALLPEGGSSLLYYATRLQQLPLSLVALAATNAVFPLLSALGERGEREELRRVHDRTHLAMAYVALPASLGLLVFAEPILAVCFEHGDFGPSGIDRSVHALRALALSILPTGAVALVVRTYYALGRYGPPVRASSVALLVHAVLSVALVAGLGMDLEGFAWSTAAAAWLNLALLLPGLRRGLQLPAGLPRIGARLLRIGGASTASVGLAWAVWRALEAPRTAAWPLLGCIFLAVVSYAAFSQILGVEEWSHLRARFRASRARQGP